MKKYSDLTEYISYYIYSQKDEKVEVRCGINQDRALEAYKRLSPDFIIEGGDSFDANSPWRFDIALDCIRNLSPREIDLLMTNLQVSSYHLGYAMYIRNAYINCANLHNVGSSDSESSEIMRIILTILHPYYDYQNPALCSYFEHPTYNHLLSNYGKDVPELFEISAKNFSSPANTKTIYEEFEYLTAAIKNELGEEIFADYKLKQF